MSISLLQTLDLTGNGQYLPGYGSYSLDKVNKILYVVYDNFNTFDSNGIQIDKIDCTSMTVLQSARYAAYNQGVLMYFHPIENSLYLVTQQISPNNGYVIKVRCSDLAQVATVQYDNQVIPPISGPYRYYTGAAALDTVNGFYYVAVSTHTNPAGDCTDLVFNNANVYQFIFKITTGASPAFSSITQLAQANNGIAAMSYDSTNNFLWAGCYQIPGKILKLNAPALTVSTTHSFPNDNSFNNVCGIAVMPTLGYGFCQSDSTQPDVSKVARFDLATATSVSTVNLPTWSYNTGNTAPSLLCGNADTMDVGERNVYAVSLPDSSDSVNQYRVMEILPQTLTIGSSVGLGLPSSGYYLANVLANSGDGKAYSAELGPVNPETLIRQLGIGGGGTFQEFYCNASGGNNLNSGFPIGGIYPLTTTNGAYTQGGGTGGGTSDRFTAVAGTPFVNAAIGDYVSVYNDGAGAPTPYIARITAIISSGASIDVDSTHSSGTRPATAANGKTATVGGEWLGPNGATAFPIGFLTAAATNGAALPRINFKNNATYNITATMTQSNASITLQGYSNSAGDGGKALVDGGTSGTNYVLLSLTGSPSVCRDFIFQHNGTPGAPNWEGINAVNSSGNFLFHRVVTRNLGQWGANANNVNFCLFLECESYSNGWAGFNANTVRTHYLRCYSHDNSQQGFLGGICVNCVADTNGWEGFTDSTQGGAFFGCDAYNNGQLATSAGISVGHNTPWYIENCNVCRNTGWGIDNTASFPMAILRNCGFGRGADINGLGDISQQGNILFVSAPIPCSGSPGCTIQYYTDPTNPWKSATTGDFRIIEQLAIAHGVGEFNQSGGKSGSTGFPNVGRNNRDIQKMDVVRVGGL